MLFITISVLLWIFFFQSLGNIAILRNSAQNPFLSVWIGFFITSFISLCISIWLPMDNNVARLLIGLVALSGIRPTLCSWRKIITGCKTRPLLLCTVCICLILFSQSAVSYFAEMGFDTNLYHGQSVRWLREYGIVPGLGNLHHRLAQISGWFALAAFMDWGPFMERTPFLLPPLWLMATFLYFSYSAFYAQCIQQRFYAICILIISIIYVNNEFYPNINYDRVALIFYSIMICEMFPIFFIPVNEYSLPKQLRLVFILLAASILFKPLAIPSLFFTMTLLSLLFWKNMISVRSLTYILWIPALTALLWCVLNAIQSGYPFFPLTAFPLPFEWVMPQNSVDNIRIEVQAWARHPGAGFREAFNEGLTYWFYPWLKRNFMQTTFKAGVVLPFIIGCTCWVMAFGQRNRQKAKLFFFFLSFTHLVYWFFQHPDFRFGLEFFWTWAALGMIFAFISSPISSQDMLVSRRIRRISLLIKIISLNRCAMIILIITTCIALTTTIKFLYSNNKINNLPLLHMPQRHEPFPGLRIYTMHSGSPQEFTVYFPPKNEFRCGNSPLPCTYVIQDIFLRDIKCLGKGFYIK